MVQGMSVEQGFVAALVGGVALQMYGSPRFTKDVDFIMDGPLSDLGSLRHVKRIEFGGDVYTAPNGVKLDLILRNDEYADLYEDALANVVGTPQGVYVVRAEHLAAMKLAAGREKDLLDLKWMIRQEDLLDLKKAREIIYRFMGRFGRDRFDDIVDQAMVEKEMQRRRGRDPEEES